MRDRRGARYDPAGNVASKLSVGGSRYDAESFSYDELDRLVWADGGSLYGTKNYSYDLLDNLSSKDGRIFGYTHPSKPHALTEDGQYSYLYDANGNLVECREGELVERSYGYDPDNHLVSLSDGGSYGYDAYGVRLWKQEGQKTTYCFFPQYEEEVEQGQPAEAVSYYFAGAQRVAKRSAGEGLVYLHADHLGSAVRATDGGSGVEVLAVGYTPYGQDALAQGSVEVKHKFTGQEQDASGLYYYGARYYDPGLGRFIQPDTMLDGLNRYTYCRNNPATYTDPTGNRTGDAPGDVTVNTTTGRVHDIGNKGTSHNGPGGYPVTTSSKATDRLEGPVTYFNSNNYCYYSAVNFLRYSAEMDKVSYSTQVVETRVGRAFFGSDDALPELSIDASLKVTTTTIEGDTKTVTLSGSNTSPPPSEPPQGPSFAGWPQGLSRDYSIPYGERFVGASVDVTLAVGGTGHSYKRSLSIGQ